VRFWLASCVFYSLTLLASSGSLPVSEPPSTTNSVDLARPTIKNALIAELFGTAILVQVGCGGLCVALYLGTMVCFVCKCC